eukprot:6311238-Pyramimonas_sp.AAC.1
MPRTQQPFDSRLERMRACAHIAERTPGGVFNRAHRADVFHRDTLRGDLPSSSGNFGFSDAPAHFAEEQQAQWIFMGLQVHERRWRRFMKKPARRVRRAVRRAHGPKGKG